MAQPKKDLKGLKRPAPDSDEDETNGNTQIPHAGHTFGATSPLASRLLASPKYIQASTPKVSSPLNPNSGNNKSPIYHPSMSAVSPLYNASHSEVTALSPLHHSEVAKISSPTNPFPFSSVGKPKGKSSPEISTGERPMASPRKAQSIELADKNTKLEGQLKVAHIEICKLIGQIAYEQDSRQAVIDTATKHIQNECDRKLAEAEDKVKTAKSEALADIKIDRLIVENILKREGTSAEILNQIDEIADIDVGDLGEWQDMSLIEIQLTRDLEKANAIISGLLKTIADLKSEKEDSYAMLKQEIAEKYKEWAAEESARMTEFGNEEIEKQGADFKKQCEVHYTRLLSEAEKCAEEKYQACFEEGVKVTKDRDAFRQRYNKLKAYVEESISTSTPVNDKYVVSYALFNTKQSKEMWKGKYDDVNAQLVEAETKAKQDLAVVQDEKDAVVEDLKHKTKELEAAVLKIEQLQDGHKEEKACEFLEMLEESKTKHLTIDDLITRTKNIQKEWSEIDRKSNSNPFAFANPALFAGSSGAVDVKDLVAANPVSFLTVRGPTKRKAAAQYSRSAPNAGQIKAAAVAGPFSVGGGAGPDVTLANQVDVEMETIEEEFRDALGNWSM